MVDLSKDSQSNKQTENSIQPIRTTSKTVNTTKKAPLSLIRRRFTLNYEPSICRSPRRKQAAKKRQKLNSSRSSPLWTPLDQVDQAKRRNQATNNSTSFNNNSSNDNNSTATTTSILFNSFIAGALAGSLSDLTVHPIDTINTRLKVSSGRHVGGTIGYTIRTVYTEGFSALYKGIGPTIYQTLPMNAVWFVTYEFSKKIGTDYCPSGYEPIVHLSSGAIGELTSSIFYVPFDVVKTRMQLGDNPHKASSGTVQCSTAYKNTFHALGSIYKKEGVKGLYSGYKAVILADCSMQALQFMFYERMKTVLVNSKRLKQQRMQQQMEQNILMSGDKDRAYSRTMENDQQQLALDAEEIFAAGAVSGGAAAFLSNPIDTVTARLMTQGYGIKVKSTNLKYNDGVIQCAKTIIREEGPQSLMRGWFPRTVRFSVLGALTLAVYEKLRDIMGFEDDDDD
jgi:solute carrier family 25 S-adenosylmethionine transporter 26